ncbi:putative toxin-antitoxin system toxin component, PIN family [Myxosarcina sp. GI1]|uniref:putative toxin-antitoxin system toxin component, PIN family n=1 Tax=Myxosarcina sp. GI1 TaxID=1541065 RepID=UPI0005615669|nr:putative toxin-antitoxin system toxin component, PIN family [Myxosarcina sp. GI1]
MKKRIVIDNNVFVSALLIKTSVPFQAVNLAFEQEILLYSEVTFSELQRVLARRKFDRYLTIEERNIFLFKLANECQPIDIKEEIKACGDTKDDKFLELAVNGDAEFIVTGDVDLLVLNPFREIEIVTLEESLNRFR